MSSDDFPQDGELVVVDFDLLEAAKENVQPLATGRRVTALSQLLATPHSQREGKLSATRNRLRINVELALEDEDGDPLEAYHRLVNWTVENYPQGHSAESGLLELLEEATRVLKDHNDGVYRGDLKYLKLWLLYASYVDRPTIIYKFLLANDIGAEFALLYEEHAAVLERDGRKQEADGVYSLGIARRAQPLDHLKARYEDFQKRMMTNMSTPTVEPTPRTTSTSQQSQRQALATTSTLPSSSSRTLGSGRSAIPSMPSSSSSRLQIFVDPTGEDSVAGGKSGWQELGTRKGRIKENVPETKKLEGSTIKQAGRAKRIASASSGLSGSSSSKIVPYRDTDDTPPPPTKAASTSRSSGSSSSSKAKAPAKGFAIFVDAQEESSAASSPAAPPKFTPFRDEDESLPKATAVPVGDAVIKVKQSGAKTAAPTSEAEALRKDPLKNYDVGSFDD